MLFKGGLPLEDLRSDTAKVRHPKKVLVNPKHPITFWGGVQGIVFGAQIHSQEVFGCLGKGFETQWETAIIRECWVYVKTLTQITLDDIFVALKTKMSPKKGTISKGTSSSNQHFRGYASFRWSKRGFFAQGVWVIGFFHPYL